MSNDPKWINKCMKNYQKSLGFPVCELPDYDFNESFDINYLRCQYDARAIELITQAEESITEHRYGAIDEARDREATRILSAPPPRRRRLLDRASAQPAPTNVPHEPAHPPGMSSLSRDLRGFLNYQQIYIDQLAYQLLLQQLYRTPASVVQAPVVRPMMSVILELDTPTEGVASCGICMSDEIPLANMVKTGCNHEYCDACISQIVRTKPCCAFCRANITKLSVNSHVVYNKLNV